MVGEREERSGDTHQGSLSITVGAWPHIPGSWRSCGPRDEDVVLCRSCGQAQNCVDEAEQPESLPSSILWSARPGPGFLLPLQNDLGFPWAGGVLLGDPLGVLRVSVVCLLRSGEAGRAWVVRLEPDPGSVGQRLLSPGSACPDDGSMNSGRAGGRAVAVAETSPGPGSGIKAASGPGEALGVRRVIIQHGGGVRSSPSKSFSDLLLLFLFILSTKFSVPYVLLTFPLSDTEIAILPPS